MMSEKSDWPNNHKNIHSRKADLIWITLMSKTAHMPVTTRVFEIVYTTNQDSQYGSSCMPMIFMNSLVREAFSNEIL